MKLRWPQILSELDQKALFKPYCEVYLAPGPENCPGRANPTCQICAKTKRTLASSTSATRRKEWETRSRRVRAWTHAVSEIVMGDRLVGPVDFASRDLVYHIACEASIMGTIPQAILRPQAPTHRSKIRARSSLDSPCVQRPFRRMIQDHTACGWRQTRTLPDAWL